jgi:hypothetical protein
MSFYPLDCQIQNYYIAVTGAQSKHAVPNFAKKSTARIMSIVGKITLLTTVFIWLEASRQVS